MRPIDADAYADHLEDALKKSVLEVDTDSIQGFVIAATLTAAVVSDLRDETITPTIDAVEIVRCKNCKYYNPIGVCIEMSSAVCEDSFCCWAERRTDERSD